MALLAWRLPGLPELVPGYRGQLVEKGALVVLRVPLIGAACLAVVHTMLRAAPSDAWRALWRWAVVCVSVKTVAEAIDLSLLGTGWDGARTVALGGTVGSVLAFVAVVALAWARGRLPVSGEGAPSWRRLRRRDRVVLVASAIAWLVLATVPAWA